MAKDKRIKKKENESIKELWDNIKHTNTHVIGVTEEDRKGQKTYTKKK